MPCLQDEGSSPAPPQPKRSKKSDSFCENVVKSFLFVFYVKFLRIVQWSIQSFMEYEIVLLLVESQIIEDSHFSGSFESIQFNSCFYF